MRIVILIWLLVLVQCGKTQDGLFKVSVELSKSIFQNYYCGNVDGFPHFKLKYNSKCENITNHHIQDREFWNDGSSPSTFFYLFNYLNQTNTNTSNEFSLEINQLINDWNISQIRDILLWDKLIKEDRYGVGNDDRLWYAISFMQIQEILGKNNQNQQFFQLSSEIFEWVTNAFLDNVCQSGVYWDIEKTYKNSITNHLYVDLAVYLYQYSQESNYMTQAKAVADWEIDQAGLIDSDYLFFDGAFNNYVCESLSKDKWTYNQGVFMRGYLALSEYYSDNKYENAVADNIITMTNNKQRSKLFNFFKKNAKSYQNPLQFHPYSSDLDYIVLLEFQNHKYSETTATFKGIFMRYLGSAYSHFSKFNTKKSQLICSSIEKYVTDNTNYILPLADQENSYPFYWDQNVSLSNQTFTAGTSISVLDLLSLNDFITKKKSEKQKSGYAY